MSADVSLRWHGSLLMENGMSLSPQTILRLNRWPLALLAVMALVLTGCVSITEPGNYRPASGARASEYYGCYRAAQQFQSSGAASIGPTYGAASAQAGEKLNSEMLERCMEARGFTLRKPNTTEVVLGVAFVPIWLPLGLLTGLGDMKIGGGRGGD